MATTKGMRTAFGKAVKKAAEAEGSPEGRARKFLIHLWAEMSMVGEQAMVDELWTLIAATPGTTPTDGA